MKTRPCLSRNNCIVVACLACCVEVLHYLTVWCLPVRYGAWTKATEEHNAYGAAATNIAYRISLESADQLFAFKVTWLNDLKYIAFEMCSPANQPMPPNLGRVTSHSAFHRPREDEFWFSGIGFMWVLGDLGGRLWFMLGHAGAPPPQLQMGVLCFQPNYALGWALASGRCFTCFKLILVLHIGSWWLQTEVVFGKNLNLIADSSYLECRLKNGKV